MGFGKQIFGEILSLSRQ